MEQGHGVVVTEDPLSFSSDFSFDQFVSAAFPDIVDVLMETGSFP